MSTRVPSEGARATRWEISLRAGLAGESTRFATHRPDIAARIRAHRRVRADGRRADRPDEPGRRRALFNAVDGGPSDRCGRSSRPGSRRGGSVAVLGAADRRDRQRPSIRCRCRVGESAPDRRGPRRQARTSRRSRSTMAHRSGVSSADPRGFPRHVPVRVPGGSLRAAARTAPRPVGSRDGDPPHGAGRIARWGARRGLADPKDQQGPHRRTPSVHAVPTVTGTHSGAADAIADQVRATSRGFANGRARNSPAGDRRGTVQLPAARIRSGRRCRNRPRRGSRASGS